MVDELFKKYLSMKQVREHVIFLKKYVTKLRDLKCYLRIWMVLMRTAVIVAIDMDRKCVHIQTASTVTTRKRSF